MAAPATKKVAMQLMDWFSLSPSAATRSVSLVDRILQRSAKPYLPEWAQEWLEVIVPGLQILLILLLAMLLQYLLRRFVSRINERYRLPRELLVPLKGILRWTIVASALLLVLERLGVSANVLWSAFTGFAAVGAVAFFAAWSVLSNLFCAFLIFTVGPFRVGDTIELLDTGDKPGSRGRVHDINLLYTTLEDSTTAEGTGTGALLQIPNALIFQRVLRRWRAGVPVPPAPAAAVLAGHAAQPKQPETSPDTAATSALPQVHSAVLTSAMAPTDPGGPVLQRAPF